MKLVDLVVKFQKPPPRREDTEGGIAGETI